MVFKLPTKCLSNSPENGFDFAFPQDEKRVRSELRRRMEKERISTLRHLLGEFTHGQLPFMTLQYSDAEGVQHLVSAVYLGKVDSPDGSKLKDMVSDLCT